jgi:hypothetical protein
VKILDYVQFRKKTLKQFCDEKDHPSGRCYRYTYMRQISCGAVRAGLALAADIEMDTEGLVTRLELLYPEKKPFRTDRNKSKKVNNFVRKERRKTSRKGATESILLR